MRWLSEEEVAQREAEQALAERPSRFWFDGWRRALRRAQKERRFARVDRAQARLFKAANRMNAEVVDMLRAFRGPREEP